LRRKYEQANRYRPGCLGHDICGRLYTTANANPGTTPAQPDVVLTVSGSGSTQRVLTAITDAFEADTPGYQLEILPGSGTGVVCRVWPMAHWI